jgi:predicted RNA-binding Zn-ribbon protein involved in translation (DUF1610 family)
VEELKSQVTKPYSVDLTNVDGGGEFRCPKCGIEISPNDKTEDVYTILETVMKKGCLEKVILQCNSCGSQIHLIGFNLLSKVG